MPTEVIDANEPAPVRNGLVELARPSIDPMQIVQQAIEKGHSPEHLGKFLEMAQVLERRAAEEAFGKALAAFQAECPPIVKRRAVLNRKDAQGNQSERYRFASYDDVHEVIAPLLRRHGISLSFTSPTTKELFAMTMRVRVGSYYEDKPYSAPMPDLGKLAGQMYLTEPQAFGIALSYHKRYCLCAGLNLVVTDEDNDAQGRVDAASAEEIDHIRRGLAATRTEMSWFLNWLNLDRLEDMTKLDYKKGIAHLTQESARQKAEAKQKGAKP